MEYLPAQEALDEIGTSNDNADLPLGGLEGSATLLALAGMSAAGTYFGCPEIVERIGLTDHETFTPDLSRFAPFLLGTGCTITFGALGIKGLGSYVLSKLPVLNDGSYHLVGERHIKNPSFLDRLLTKRVIPVDSLYNYEGQGGYVFVNGFQVDKVPPPENSDGHYSAVLKGHLNGEPLTVEIARLSTDGIPLDNQMYENGFRLTGELSWDGEDRMIVQEFDSAVVRGAA